MLRETTAEFFSLHCADTTQERLVGAATVFFERKFIRGCGLVGHIEDVVVDSN